MDTVPVCGRGTILNNHPFDMVYNHGIRHLTGGPVIPRYPVPRRFACILASAWITAEALYFTYGMPLAGHIPGWSLVATATVPVTTGFCIPSFIYGLIFRKPQELIANT